MGDGSKDALAHPEADGLVIEVDYGRRRHEFQRTTAGGILLIRDTSGSPSRFLLQG
jgi:hypothetical protein